MFKKALSLLLTAVLTLGVLPVASLAAEGCDCGVDPVIFIDGLNGLSLTMAILCLTFLGALSGNGWVIPAVSIAAGMFFWNFPVAHTFVGDGGVYLLGYYIAMIAALWLREADIGLIRFVVLLLLIGGVPVIDTLCAISRRLFPVSCTRRFCTASRCSPL